MRVDPLGQKTEGLTGGFKALCWIKGLQRRVPKAQQFNSVMIKENTGRDKRECEGLTEKEIESSRKLADVWILVPRGIFKGHQRSTSCL